MPPPLWERGHRTSYVAEEQNRLAVRVVAVIAIAAIGSALRSHSTYAPPASFRLLSTTQQARVPGSRATQARVLGDPRLGHATVILGPQTAQATGGVHFTKSEAYIVLYGRFRCDHSHDTVRSPAPA